MRNIIIKSKSPESGEYLRDLIRFLFPECSTTVLSEIVEEADSREGNAGDCKGTIEIPKLNQKYG